MSHRLLLLAMCALGLAACASQATTTKTVTRPAVTTATPAAATVAQASAPCAAMFADLRTFTRDLNAFDPSTATATDYGQLLADADTVKSDISGLPAANPDQKGGLDELTGAIDAVKAAVLIGEAGEDQQAGTTMQASVPALNLGLSTVRAICARG